MLIRNVKMLLVRLRHLTTKDAEPSSSRHHVTARISHCEHGTRHDHFGTCCSCCAKMVNVEKIDKRNLEIMEFW